MENHAVRLSKDFLFVKSNTNAIPLMVRNKDLFKKHRMPLPLRRCSLYETSSMVTFLTYAWYSKGESFFPAKVFTRFVFPTDLSPIVNMFIVLSVEDSISCACHCQTVLFQTQNSHVCFIALNKFIAIVFETCMENKARNCTGVCAVCF